MEQSKFVGSVSKAELLAAMAVLFWKLKQHRQPKAEVKLIEKECMPDWTRHNIGARLCRSAIVKAILAADFQASRSNILLL